MWTRADYIREWPASPNPYSNSGEVFAGGQLVDEGAMLRAMAEHDRMMSKCRCDWDIDSEGRGYNMPPAEGCPVHPAEEEE
jgi:hypothetical protein